VETEPQLNAAILILWNPVLTTSSLCTCTFDNWSRPETWTAKN